VVQEGLFPLAFTEQPRFRVGARDMRSVTTLFPVEIDRGVAGVRVVPLRFPRSRIGTCGIAVRKLEYALEGRSTSSRCAESGTFCVPLL
jgi:hypothetical protein